MKLNKKLAVPLLLILGLGLIVATGYVVKSMTVTADVVEPFNSVEYAITDTGTLCSAAASWVDMADIDLGDFYAGESGKICFKIDNYASASIPYTISGEVLTGYEFLSKIDLYKDLGRSINIIKEITFIVQ